MKTKCRLPITCVAGVALYLVSTASAELNISGVESGGDVIFTFSGELNTAGGEFEPSFSIETILDPMNGIIEAWQSNSDANRYTLVSAVPFGFGGVMTDIGVGAGDNIGIIGNSLYLDAAYGSGSPLSATLTFAGTSLDTLGIGGGPHTGPGGPYVFTLAATGDTIVLTFLPQTVLSDRDRLRKWKRKIRKLKRKASQARRMGQPGKARKLKGKRKRLESRVKILVSGL